MAIWPFLLMFVPLVLFHEFGHFIVARWCGVRVLSFSIGFGPTLLKWQRGHTEYAIRLLPLGGFVKMLGDDPSAPPEAEMLRNPDAFAAKAVWQRAAIVAAGPIANFILPMITLVLVGLIFHGQVVPSRIGAVLPDGPAELAGLRTGDLITAVDGTPVRTFDDMRRVIEDRAGKSTLINFERMGQQQKLQVTPVSHREVLIPELGLVRNVGKIQIVPQPESSAIAVVPGSVAWRAGLRSGDRIAAVAGAPTTRYYELDEALGKAAKLGLPTLNLAVLTLRPIKGDQKSENATRLHPGAARDVQISLQGAKTTAELGISVAHRVVGDVEPKSPADLVGLKPGDEITALDGKPLRSLHQMAEALLRPYDDVRSDPANRGESTEVILGKIRAVLKPHAITVRHCMVATELPNLQAIAAGGQNPKSDTEKAFAGLADRQLALAQGFFDRTAQFTLLVDLGKDERPRPQHGLTAVLEYEDAALIANPDLVGNALVDASEKMIENVKVIVLSVVGLFRGHVPVKEVGGPIFMAQLAAQTVDRGVDSMLNLLAFLSINLGVINLLPIPLVDGGHLLFLAIEAIKRRPVSLRTRQVAAYLGMTFLGLLFLVVMKNDLTRWFRG